MRIKTNKALQCIFIIMVRQKLLIRIEKQHELAHTIQNCNGNEPLNQSCKLHLGLKKSREILPAHKLPLLLFCHARNRQVFPSVFIIMDRRDKSFYRPP